MSDTPERKKLTLQPAATKPAAGRGDDDRVRSGPRARRVAQATLENRKFKREDDGADPQTPPAPRAERAPRADARRRTDERAAPRDERPRDRGVRNDAGPTPAKYRRGQPARGLNTQNQDGAQLASPEAQGAPGQAVVRTSGPEVFPVFAPCPQGLEAVLVDELKSLGFADAWAGRAGAHFTADWTAIMRANLHSRLATRILVQVNHGTVHDENDLLELARATPWERWFGAEQTLRVDTSAVRSPMKSLQFCNLRAKDGICDRLREREGERPSIDTVRPDARVHVFLSETSATLYLDTSGESLFKRGWRLDKGEAPLRENLAAGLLALSGWQTDAPLLDPFCGSGTIVIEAALKALRVPPGVSRPFAFERLRGHQEWRWRDLKDDARAKILKELPMQLAGADIDERAIAAARGNAERAGLTEDAVYFEVADARDTCPLDDKAGWIISNPPYGERLDMADDAGLWAEWATTLKREFGGWHMNLITNDFDLPKKLRLNPSRRTPLYNGALDCRLFGFELVSGGFRR